MARVAQLAVLFSILAITSLGLAAATVAASSSSTEVVATVCCLNCPAPLGCCCPRYRGPVTVKTTRTVNVKRTSTKFGTRTATVTVVAKNVARRGLDGDGSASSAPWISADVQASEANLAERSHFLVSPNRADAKGSTPPDSEFAAPTAADGPYLYTSGRLFRRNLCPVCLTSSPKAFNAKSNNQGVPCCPKRKTVTKKVTTTRTALMVKTGTKVVTRTVLQVPQPVRDYSV